MSAERHAEPRRGRHPRNPRISETVNPHEGVPAPDLNQSAEDDSIDIGADIDPEKWKRFQEKLRKQREDDSYNGSSDKPGRGPDLQPRQHQPRVMDSAAGENPRDGQSSISAAV